MPVDAMADAPARASAAVGVGAAVSLRGVSKVYATGASRVDALRDIDLEIGAGELVVVLGPSGCGKTTLLNVIGALDTATAGAVVVAGQDISRASSRALFAFRRTTVSFIFQSFNLFPGLTARENVEFGVDVSKRFPRSHAMEVLAGVGLAARAEHFPHELSGGEQQRVAIARALATGNPVLLADEPTGELDYRTGVQILELLQAQASEGRTVLLVTHNREISRIADRVVELSGGAIVADGPPEGGRQPIAGLRW
jgi:putative ABC transport system ATP-binding protein